MAKAHTEDGVPLLIDHVDHVDPAIAPALSRWLHPDGAPWGTDPDAWDPSHVQSVKRRLDGWFGPRRYFRVSTSGWEHLPPAPALIVSNHSGGTTVLDGMGFGHAWYHRFGALERPLHGLVHDMLFTNALTGPFFANLGCLRASKALARRVLGELRRDMIVFPGGDQDTWRPFRDRYRVRFAGRTGYARMALALGIPVVPLAHAGAQETFVVLGSGRRIARAVGLHRLARAEIWPVHLSLPWGLAVGPFPHVPLPARLDYRLGPAVPFPPGARPGHPPTRDQVLAYDREVRAAIQSLLDQLRDARRARRSQSSAWFGRAPAQARYGWNSNAPTS